MMKFKHIIPFFLLTICLSGISQVSLNRVTNSRQTLMPYNRIIQPAGMQIYFGDRTLENHALDVALSPDHKWLAVEERYSVVFISTVDKEIKYVLDMDIHADLQGGMNTYSGIIWHKGKNGKEVYWSTVGRDNRSYVVSATWDGSKAVFGRMFEYIAQAPSKVALPNEILIANEASKEYLYVVLNGNNQLIKQDLNTGDTIWKTDPGVAPYGIATASGKLYITNWAGRHPDKDDKNVAGVPWGLARVNNESAGGATREGSIAVIDMSTGKILKEVIVGLHPNEIISD